ncbi:unnamed protein product [Malus baccata var. baccata]
MINLRHLILEKCGELTRMSRELGELTGLGTLGTVALSKNNYMWRGSAGLGELRRLKELRGELDIINLRHVKDVMLESNVGAPVNEKQHLHSLNLNWKRGEDVNAVDEKDIIMSMEVLQPHSNLKELSVWFYGGLRFASWFSSLINIINLRLHYCERCQNLPPLDHLPSLKYLELSHLKNNSISDEMMMMSFFPALEKLSMYSCPVLKGWWRAHTHNSASSSSSTENLFFPLPSFPCLSTLIIQNCRNLSSMSLCPNVDRIRLYRTSLKDITHDVGVNVSATSSSPHLSKLTYLSLYGIENLECLTLEGMGSLTSLQLLSITFCPNLASLPEEISNITSLQQLEIDHCSNLASLPEGIRGLSNLNKLQVWRCPILSERCEKEKGEDWPKNIGHIPYVRIE